MLIKEIINIFLLILIGMMAVINYRKNTDEKLFASITLILVVISLILYLI